MAGPVWTAWVAVLALAWWPAGAGGASVSNLLAEGVAAFESGSATWTCTAFSNAVSRFEQACEGAPDSFEAHYWLGAARFHVLLHALGESDQGISAKAAATRDAAIRALERALELRKDDAESHALLSVLYGMQIAEHPATALWRGPRVLRHQKRARRADPGNPRTAYLLGMSHLYAPSILGGRRKARALLEEAVTLFEAAPARRASALAPAWGYAHTLSFLGEMAREEGDLEAAAAYYRKALAENPRHPMALKGLELCQSLPKHASP